MSLRGPAPDRLGEERHPDAHQLAALALLLLLGAQRVVADHVHGLAHGRLVVARVVHPAGLGLVRKLVRLQQVLQPQLRRVHLQLERQAVHQPLDEVHRLGDAERTRVGDAAGRLVRVHRGHVAVGGLDVVAAGEHAEEAGRVLHRRGRAVEGAVVGEHVGPDRQDLAVVGGGDLADHDVVAGEAGAGEVLAAVLHPLDRLAEQQRADDRAHVARVDRHLVAEPAADIGRDDPDLVLGQAGHQRVQRAVRVRCLRRRPQRELSGHRVQIGDRTAGFHRRGMHTRIDDLLLDDDVGLGERGLGGRGVTGLPVEAVVVGLAVEVGADHRGVGVERLAARRRRDRAGRTRRR